MRDVRVVSSETGGKVLVEFRFKALDQLLDASDPYPLPERELTEFAEEYIAGYLEEYRLKNLSGLIINLPQDQLSPELSSLLPDTIRRQFTSRLQDLNHEARLSLREGRISLGIAAFNAAIGVLFILLFADRLDSPVFLLLGGLITILNWVTIWGTYEHFAYDYRNLKRRQRIYRTIAGMEIRITGAIPAHAT
jgi:hypothetical protein